VKFFEDFIQSQELPGGTTCGKMTEARKGIPRAQMQIPSLSYVRRNLNFGLLQWKWVTAMIQALAVQKRLS